MKTVISASRRTDIPAFYLKWFMDAIRDGHISVQNPIYRQSFKEIDLRPEKVEWIVFWSRNYNTFLRYYNFFSGYRLFFHFTILSHHPKLERIYLPSVKALKQIEKLANLYGPDHIIWRYDPLVFWKEGGRLITNFNSSEFAYLCRAIGQLEISRCYFSFVTPYAKFIKRFKSKYPQDEIVSANTNLQNDILSDMRSIAERYHIQLYSCCNDSLVGNGIHKGSCISGSLLNHLSGKKIISEAKTPTRRDCGCTRSVDIGNYIQQPCAFGCIYCYANPVWKAKKQINKK